MKLNLRIALPIAVLGAGVLGAAALVMSRPEVQTRERTVPPPLVRVTPVAQETHRLKVTAHGTVKPRTESTLVSQVAGQVTAVSSAFAHGGFFEAGDTLVTVDPRDYLLALTRAKAQVAQVEVRLAREKEEAAAARQEWDRIGNGQPSALVLRKPQLAEARAAIAGARASMEQARLNLERTAITAPFAGRVRTTSVDVGQVVNPGTPVARIYSVDYAEVRLPVPDGQLAYLDLSMRFRGELIPQEGPEVLLHANFAGQEYTWIGRIVGVEGEIDSRTRMVTLIARVADPYGRGEEPDRPPLAAGLFVEAEILGYEVEDVVILPRSALRTSDQVLVVSEEDRLYFRRVDVLRSDAETVVIRSGLDSGERICLSPLDAVVEGMRVRAVTDERPPAPTGRGGDA